MLLLVATALAAAPTAGTLTLVESWPVETTLDDPSIADAADVWVRSFDAAKKSIDLSHFYAATEPGSKMEGVIAALTRAADRGVTVRFLVDKKMSKTYPEPLASLDAHAKIEVRTIDYDTMTGGVQHAKYFIVDGTTAFVGSQNFDWRSLEHVQELGFLIDAPVPVALYSRIYAIDWSIAGGKPLDVAVQNAPAAKVEASTVTVGTGTASVTALASPTGYVGGDEAWDLPQLMAAIGGAKKTIRMQALSYERIGYDKTDWPDLYEALKTAAGRGVKVEMIVADWAKSGNKLESVQALARVPGVTVKFASIPEAKSGFIPFSRVVHSKFVVVDDTWTWIGTSNFGRDYFYESRDLAIVGTGAALATPVTGLFQRLWDSSYTEVVDPERTNYVAPRRK